jgi:predicted MFS family arabinose efflux permease
MRSDPTGPGADEISLPDAGTAGNEGTAEPVRPGGLRRMFLALQVPNYRLFFAGQFVSVTGTWMQRVAQDWLILEVGGGAFELSLGVALQSVPMLLFGMWGGLFVDRVRHPRALLLGTQIAMAGLALLLGTLIITGHVTLAVIYVTTFVMGCVGVIDTPARQTFVLDMVGTEQAANAVSLNSSINNSARLIGPAIAGVVIGLAGTGVAYLINATTFLAIIAALLLMHAESLGSRTPEPRGRGQLIAGFRYVWGTPTIRNALGATLLVSTFSQNFRVTLPLMASTVFHGGASSYGWLMSFLGIGALVGALLCAYLARPSLRMVTVEMASFGILILAASVAPTYAVMLLIMLGVGAGNTSFNSTANALVLLTARSQMRGRVLSIRGLVSQGSTPIGSLGIGWVCEEYGPRAGLAVGGICALLACTFTTSLRPRRRRPSPTEGALDD